MRDGCHSLFFRYLLGLNEIQSEPLGVVAEDHVAVNMESGYYLQFSVIGSSLTVLGSPVEITIVRRVCAKELLGNNHIRNSRLNFKGGVKEMIFRDFDQ
jgi:hypothetical protein